MAALGFFSIHDIIKHNFDPQTKAKSPIPLEAFEDALFNHLSLKTQNKMEFEAFQDPERVHRLRKAYTDEINNSNMDPAKKESYTKAVSGALDRFELSLSIRQSLFAGVPLKFEAGRLNKIRREYTQRHRKQEQALETLQKTWEKEDRKEAKLIQEIAAEQKKRLDEEQRAEHHHSAALAIGSGAVALSTKVLADPEIASTSNNLNQNLADLNRTMQQSLQNPLQQSDNMPGMDLRPTPGQVNKLNQDVASLEQTMRNSSPNDPNNPQNSLNQFNQVLNDVQQQYQMVQAAVLRSDPTSGPTNATANAPTNNPTGQQLLFQWGTHAEQNLTQLLTTGNVQTYDDKFKKTLGNEWNALANTLSATKEVQNDRVSQTPENPLDTALKATANILDPLSPDTPKNEQEDQDKKVKSKNPFAIPTKPGPPDPFQR